MKNSEGFMEIGATLPCVRGNFGHRVQTFSVQVKMRDIASLLGGVGSSSVPSFGSSELEAIYDALRPKRHADTVRSVSGTMERIGSPDDNRLAAIPPVMIAFMRPAKFTPAVPGGEIGAVTIDISEECLRVVVQGLETVNAALDLRRRPMSPVLSDVTIPVTLVAPSDGVFEWEDILFLTDTLALAGGSTETAGDRVSLVCAEFYRTEFIKSRGGVEHSASLGSKSKAVAATGVLKRAIRNAVDGPWLPDRVPPLPLQGGPLEIAESLAGFFDGFAYGMGSRFPGGINMNAIGWQALAGLFHYAHHHHDGDRAALRALGMTVSELDWSKDNPDWIEIGIVTPDGGVVKRGEKALADFILFLLGKSDLYVLERTGDNP
jgi:hypothetical protein